MTEQHPITVPTGSITCWKMLYRSLPPEERSEVSETEYIATQAARWGADQELEACIDFVRRGPWCSEKLRAARRPKPPSLKEQALAEMELLETEGSHACSLGILRRALEALPND